ncbi:Interferon-inducible double-stranded RNA-dependent protein kinase activator [Dirofilaria immitis]
MEKLYEVFTHVDVLKSREPEYFICEKPVVVDLDDLTGNKNSKNNKETKNIERFEVMDNDNEQIMEIKADGGSSASSTGTSVPPVKTFVSILEEGCKKYYDGTPPIFTPGLTDMPNSFAVRCELYGVHTVGQGRTKKIAKQMAAKDMLKKMIEKESFSDFGLGKTKEEALANLENITADFQNRGNSDDFVIENWIGKVNERCQKMKLSNAVYEIDEGGPANHRIFIAKCKIGKINVIAQGKTKKIAKTLAAQKMCAQLENWKDLADDIEIAALAATNQEPTSHTESATNKSEDVDSSSDTVMHSESLQKIHAAFRDGFGAKDLAEKLADLIKSGDESINKVFLNEELKFIFLKPDVDGNFQCMLSINGPNDMKNVFYGFGTTEADAKDYASRNALVYLELFVRTSEPPKNSSGSVELQVMDSSSVPAKNFLEEGIS